MWQGAPVGSLRKDNGNTTRAIGFIFIYFIYLVTHKTLDNVKKSG